MADICFLCFEESGSVNCKYCPYGNPCLNCEDYDVERDRCKSNGACGTMRKESDSI